MAETEAVLLRRFVRSGDAEAFAEIIRLYAGLVYSAALRVLADVDRASDIAQETFLQLAKDAGTVTGSLPGWLHRVATHKAIDQVRRDATRRHREAEYVAVRPHETVDWKEISPYVDEGLNLLDPQLRHILISHFLEGRSTREIARTQGLSQATISRRIASGVEQLRAGLRRRGILVAAGALAVLLGENAVEAAPQALAGELGKIALISGSLAASGTAAGTASGLGSAATSLVTAVKTYVFAAAAVVVIGAGSVIVYRQAATPSAQPSTAPLGSAVVGASGLDGAPVSDPGVGEAFADGQMQGRGPDTEMSTVAGPIAAGARPSPMIQGLPGAEAETDPRTYVPGRNGAGLAGFDGVVATAPGQPPAEASGQQPPVENSPHGTTPAMDHEDSNGPTVASMGSPYETVMRLRREATGESDASLVPEGPVVARAKLRFVPPLTGNPGGVLGFQRQDTTTVRPAGMLETPPDAPREPMYFVVRAGNREIQGITYRSTQSPGQVILCLDTDSDGLWSDEKTYTGRRLWVFSMTATYEFGPVCLKQDADGPAGNALYVQCSDGKRLTFWPAFYRSGEVLLDGKTYLVSLVDADFDGRFNESLVAPVTDSRNPGCDVLAIDLNGDARFTYGRPGGSEIMPLGKLVQVDGRHYRVEIAEDGGTIEFRQAEPALGRPAPDVTPDE